MPANPQRSAGQCVCVAARFRPGSTPAVFSEIIIGVGGCECGMRIRRADHAEFERIDTRIAFDNESSLSAPRGRSRRPACRSFSARERQIAAIPSGVSVGGELIVGRQERVRLGIALDLGCFHQWFPARAPLVA